MSFLPLTELSSSSSRCLYIDCNDCFITTTMYLIDTNIVFHTLGINSRHNIPVQYKTNTESNAYF
jgi:hypothetical protein